ncbi:MAG TPA: tRNA 2-thiouridine(34) synthase MnmA [Firmicutes bacterium]|nr:tRNA 2-thiouridine(34) synthase MnmA [Bacillota bacterium]
MSGGVDSSVAAALLLKQGYEVIGVTMQIWPSDLPYGEEVEGGCCSLGAVEDARAVAGKLGIPYYVLNFQAPFREKVIDYFVAEYLQGRTPNPCIVCNHSLKFDNLLEKSLSLGGDFIATGHYVQKDQDLNTGRWLLRKGIDGTKDQSYVLYGLKQAQLARSLFPLGGYEKTAIRKIAAEIGLRVADKPDSQEICFIPDQDYGRFINEYSPGSVKPGTIVDPEGHVLGRHQGISNFTIGQRKGLGIATGTPLFVTEIRPETNEVVVGTKEGVFSKGLLASKINWIAFDTLNSPQEVEVKIRYSAKPVLAIATPVGPDQVKIEFQNPQPAVTPGQAVVFYRSDLMLGGGTIDKSFH